MVETLIAASQNPESLYIVVFDEMNLARVEHYFSQFLSVLEKPESSRAVRLYNQQLASRLYNSTVYPDQIKIGDNVLFVGTVNTDESTFQFSDKVLDRSNVISLHIVPFNQEHEDGGDTLSASDNTVNNMTVSDYHGLVDYEKATPLTKMEKSLLWDMHVALNQTDRNLGIGWRIVRQIESFLKALPEIEQGVTRNQAFDLQLVQRVLTKIRGSEEQLRDLIGASEDNAGELLAVLDKYATLGQFDASRAVIKQKARELKLYGFTM